MCPEWIQLPNIQTDKINHEWLHIKTPAFTMTLQQDCLLRRLYDLVYYKPSVVKPNK